MVVCDKLKLLFTGYDSITVDNVRANMKEAIARCPDELISGLAETLVEEGNWSTRSWSSAGKLIRLFNVEWTGLIAHHVFLALPLSYWRYVSYFHSKEFYSDVDGVNYVDFVNRATDTPMFRNTSKVSPRREGNGRKRGKLPLLRVGSAKSDLQVVTYAAYNQPMGIESRLKDKALKSLILDVQRTTQDNDDGGEMAREQLLLRCQDKGVAMLRKLADDCGYETLGFIYGTPTTKKDMYYYWEFTDIPHYFQGSNVDTKGFVRQSAARQEQMHQHRIADDLGLAFSEGVSGESEAQL
jgi:hypothetical protein